MSQQADDLAINTFYEQTVANLKAKCHATEESPFLLAGVQRLRDALANNTKINPLDLYDVADTVHKWDNSHPFHDIGIEGKMAKFFGRDRADDPKTQNPALYNNATFMADFDTFLQEHPVIKAYDNEHGFDNRLILDIFSLQDDLRIDPYRYSHAADSAGLDSTSIEKSNLSLQVSLRDGNNKVPEYQTRFTLQNVMHATLYGFANQKKLREIAEVVVSHYDSACNQLVNIRNGETLGVVIEECLEKAVNAHMQRLEKQSAEETYQQLQQDGKILPESSQNQTIDSTGVIDVSVIMSEFENQR